MLEGQEVKLTCKTTCRPSENATVIWGKNGDNLHAHKTTNNELIFQNVSTGNEGNYFCALKGYEEYPSKPEKLNVMCECLTKLNEGLQGHLMMFCCFRCLLLLLLPFVTLMNTGNIYVSQ